MQEVYLVGGHIRDENDSKGNVFTVPSNRYAEFNMLLDPLAAKIVLESSLDITLIPLISQRKAASFQFILHALKHVDHTPESSFVRRLMLLLYDLQKKHRLYNHMVNICNFFISLLQQNLEHSNSFFTSIYIPPEQFTNL